MKKRNYHLGIHARNLLLWVFPLIIIELLTLIAYIVPLEGSELVKNEAIVWGIFDGIGRGIIFAAMATLILDYMEKKEAKSREE